ncbi:MULTISPECIES: hypothetical protein [unclassified Archaeoglobus]|jgi:hypothetical protein|uniref:hypothetical protein n=1 Tax=unclassified Archaeoglobus TaxID=2643606 RepID=UPI0025B8D612|nr:MULTISPECIES: hypothetical protein [unclassified Archaeoglobus]
MLSGDVVAALLLLAGAAVIQFFRGRKLNLALVQFYASQSVEVFKPVDKTYTWLGGYIGYRASFELEDGTKLEYTLTLLPRHSLLYFPISLLTNRHDKLYLVFRLKELGGEAHLIQKGYYRLRPSIENEITLLKEVIRIAKRDYEAIYDKKSYVEWIVKFIEGFSRPENVKHVSLTPSTKVLYVQMKPEPETFRKDMEHTYSFLRANMKKLK